MANLSQPEMLKTIGLRIIALQRLDGEAPPLATLSQQLRPIPIAHTDGDGVAVPWEPPQAERIHTAAPDTVVASVGRMRRSMEIARELQDILEDGGHVNRFDIPAESLWGLLYDRRRLQEGGLEEWEVTKYAHAKDMQPRPIGVLANAAKTAADGIVLRSEALSVLGVMFAVLHHWTLSDQDLRESWRYATMISVVGSKARVLHACVEQGEPKITFSRYFDTSVPTEVEGVLAAAFPKSDTPGYVNNPIDSVGLEREQVADVEDVGLSPPRVMQAGNGPISAALHPTPESVSASDGAAAAARKAGGGRSRRPGQSKARDGARRKGNKRLDNAIEIQGSSSSPVAIPVRSR